MTFRKASVNQFVAILVAATAMGACLVRAERGQSADADPVPKCPSAGRPDSKFIGITEECDRCHRDGKEPTELARMDEFSVWDPIRHDTRRPADKHRHAFEALTCDRAKKMESLLDMKPGEAATSRQCIACHAIDVTADSAGEGLSSADSRDKLVKLGVSCEACHGRASLWIDKHHHLERWRDLPPQESDEKYDRYGMTKLRDPVRRTELCLSCHLGNIACGKFVTHEMFAAGHPPLPAFEVEAFFEKMPPHWRPASPAVPVPHDEGHSRPIPPLISRTRSVAFEGLVTLRASVRLLADAERLPGGGDFAVYDCAACHHELQIPSARQERGYLGGAPGRPPLRAWNIPLAVAPIESQSSKDGTIAPSRLDTALARLQTATRSRPFGDAQAVQAASRDAIEQLDQAITGLEGKTFGGQTPRLLAGRICRAGAKMPLDYESAWQLTGALRALVADMEHPVAGDASTPSDPKIKLLIDELSELVHFPSAPVSSTDPQAKYGGTLWEDGADFKPAQFRDKLGEIVKLLGSQ